MALSGMKQCSQNHVNQLPAGTHVEVLRQGESESIYGFISDMGSIKCIMIPLLLGGIDTGTLAPVTLNHVTLDESGDRVWVTRLYPDIPLKSRRPGFLLMDGTWIDGE